MGAINETDAIGRMTIPDAAFEVVAVVDRRPANVRRQLSDADEVVYEKMELAEANLGAELLRNLTTQLLPQRRTLLSGDGKFGNL